MALRQVLAANNKSPKDEKGGGQELNAGGGKKKTLPAQKMCAAGKINGETGA